MNKINMTKVMRYTRKDGVITTISKCEVSQNDLMRDLVYARELHECLTTAITNMTAKLRNSLDDDI